MVELFFWMVTAFKKNKNWTKTNLDLKTQRDISHHAQLSKNQALEEELD